MTQDPAPKSMWAYAYQIVPPQSEVRLAAVKALLDREHTRAKASEHTFEGRFVHEEKITHLLVVTDTPEQTGEANKRLEAALAKLQAGFVLTAPLAVTDEATPPGTV